MQWFNVAAGNEIGEGEAMSVAAGSLIIALVRSDGLLYAIEDVCTHDGEALTGGGIEDRQIICPRHGARFCLRTGEALTPPAYEPVRVFETKLEDGRVWVLAD